jgi:subtilisin family serine protease
MKTTRKNCKTLLLCLLIVSFNLVNAQVKNPKKTSDPVNDQNDILSIIQKQNLEPKKRLSSDLTKMANESLTSLKRSSSKGKSSLMNIYEKKYLIKGDKIVVEIVANSTAAVADIKKSLKALSGVSNIISFENTISCLIPMKNLKELEKNSKIKLVREAEQPTMNIGKVDSQGDKALKTDIARANFNVNGKGVKIGILSDSYNNLGGEALGVKNGELPGKGNPNGFTKPVVVLQELDTTFGRRRPDEGRAMAEIVHDVAPGAEIYFHTAFEGEVNFANAIVKLTDAGCKVIVDDILYFAEPFFQDGLVAKAIEYAKNKGVHYFTAAGNSASNAYEFDYNPEYVLGQNKDTIRNADGTPFTRQKFYTNLPNTAPSDFPLYVLPFNCKPVSDIRIDLQWDEPYVSVSGGSGAKTQLAIVIYDKNFVADRSVFLSNQNVLGKDPYQTITSFFAGEEEDDILYLAIVKLAGPDPKKIHITLRNGAKLLDGEIGNLYYNNLPGVNAHTIIGHCNSKDAFTVGAAYYAETVSFGAAVDVIENFSSLGGNTILFDKNGNRVNEVRMKPDFVAPDKANTSFFISGFDPDNDGFPNFPGTSAAAPHAAAVAALAIEARSCFPIPISPDAMKTFFQFNTRDMDDPATPDFDYGFDFRTGHGFIDAEEIVGFFDLCSSGGFATGGGSSGSSGSSSSKLENVTINTFPNPVTDYLNITFSDSNGKVSLKGIRIDISNLSGTQSISSSSSSETDNVSVNVRNLPSGLYMATISNQEGVSKTVKFIK